MPAKIIDEPQPIAFGSGELFAEWVDESNKRMNSSFDFRNELLISRSFRVAFACLISRSFGIEFACKAPGHTELLGPLGQRVVQRECLSEFGRPTRLLRHFTPTPPRADLDRTGPSLGSFFAF
jgi:hypothetical protein